MAPLSVSAGFKVTHTPYSKLAVSLESAQQSIPSKRLQPSGPKNGFLRPNPKSIPENEPVSGMLNFL
jgi:hypothetical protein